MPTWMPLPAGHTSCKASAVQGPQGWASCCSCCFVHGRPSEPRGLGWGAMGVSMVFEWPPDGCPRWLALWPSLSPGKVSREIPPPGPGAGPFSFSSQKLLAVGESCLSLSIMGCLSVQTGPGIWPLRIFVDSRWEVSKFSPNQPTITWKRFGHRILPLWSVAEFGDDGFCPGWSHEQKAGCGVGLKLEVTLSRLQGHT